MSKRYIQAKQLLFVAINELDKSGSPFEVVDAIEEFVLAAMTDAFNARFPEGKTEGTK